MLDSSPDVYEAVKGLRVVRRYEDRPISEQHLDAILDAGRWTGSSKNRQSWVFVVVRDRAQIGRLAECGDFTGPLKGADTVVVPVRLPEGYDWDLGRASQNIMLAAASVGVGSCPITFHRHADARRVLGVPDDHGCMWGIALGYPDAEAERELRTQNPLSGRKPLDDVVRMERFS